MSKVFIDFTEVGKRIAERRKLLNMQQKELAEKCGLEPNTITKIETSGTGLSVETLASMCKALEVAPNYLLCGAEAGLADIEKVAEKFHILTNPEHIKIISGLIDVMANVDFQSI